MSLDNFNVDKKEIKDQTFWIGDNAEIKVKVVLYEENDMYQLTSWLHGTKELHTVEYEGSMDDIEILAAMEKMVNDNEREIVDIALRRSK